LPRIGKGIVVSLFVLLPFFRSRCPNTCPIEEGIETSCNGGFHFRPRVRIPAPVKRELRHRHPPVGFTHSPVRIPAPVKRGLRRLSLGDSGGLGAVQKPLTPSCTVQLCAASCSAGLLEHGHDCHLLDRGHLARTLSKEPPEPRPALLPPEHEHGHARPGSQDPETTNVHE
jgi:hypothetical protein